MTRALLVFALSLGACTPGDAPRSEAPRTHPAVAGDLECDACHSTDGWQIGRGTGSRGMGFDHRTTGFPLAGRHADTGCASCHVRNEAVVRECLSCHEDVHQGRLGVSCDDCHSARAFTEVRAIELHRRTQLPLTGMHAIADCTECHERTTSAPFSAVPADCFACHANDYRRTDIHPLHTGGAGEPFARDCTQCHTAMGWLPAIVDPSAVASTGALSAPGDHELRFPIAAGSHAGLPCQSCHANEANPRLFQCTGCHAHAPGLLASQHGGLPMLDGPSCVSCHPGGAMR